MRQLTIDSKDALKRAIDFLYGRVLLMPIRCYEKLQGTIDEVETGENFKVDDIVEWVFQPDNVRELAVGYIQRGESFVRDAKADCLTELELAARSFVNQAAQRNTWTPVGLATTLLGT